MKKFYSLLATGALLAVASTALAGQPLQLTDGQMDHVTAGSFAIANAGGFGIADFAGDTSSATEAEVNAFNTPPGSVALSANTSFAISVLSQALAVSHSDAAAQY